MNNLPVLKFGDHKVNVDNVTLQSLELFTTEQNRVHAVNNNHAIDFEIVDQNEQQITVLHNHLLFTVNIQDTLQQRIASMGWDKTEDLELKAIKAPMPGLVLEISVKEGDVVEKGTKLLVLEAMKMENVIAIQAKTTIGKIHVTKGAAVEKGQLLIELLPA